MVFKFGGKSFRAGHSSAPCGPTGAEAGSVDTDLILLPTSIGDDSGGWWVVGVWGVWTELQQGTMNNGMMSGMAEIAQMTSSISNGFDDTPDKHTSRI